MRRFTFLFFTLSFCFISFNVFTNTGGPPDGLAGEPPLNETCANSCHGGSALNSGGGTATIVCKDSLGNIVTNYNANQTYTITLSITEGAKKRYGFEAIIMKGTGGSAAALGTLLITDTSTKLFGNNPAKIYVMHKASGVNFTGTIGSWSFKWKAPNANYGLATVYAAFNATNSNNTSSGDKIYSKTLALNGNGPQVGITNSPSLTRTQPYPNPAQNQITLELNQPSSVTIYNLNGSEVKRISSNDFYQNLDIHDLPKGFYILVVSDETNTETYKFIKE